MGGSRTATLLGVLLLLMAAGPIAQVQAQEDEEELRTTGDGPYEFGEKIDIMLEMRDGVELHGTVYLPDMPEDEVAPVVLELSPYFGVFGATDTHEFTDPPGTERYNNLLERGYAIALFSLRGSGLSEGCLDVGGPIAQADSYELVQWLADQPWSNGKVGMTGYSYPGSTPWMAVVATPPALETIVPVSGITDWYSYMWRNGTPLPLSTVFEAYYPGISQFAYAGNDPGRFAQALDSRVCPGWVERIAAGPLTYATGDHDEFWDERDYTADFGRMEASAFVVHGMQDWNVKTDQIAPFNEIPTETRLLAGQWGHGFPWMDSAAVEGYESMSKQAYDQRVETWLDHWLKDKPYPAEAPTVEVQAPDGTWRTPDAWPTPGTGKQIYELTGDGQLEEGHETIGEQELGWMHTPKTFGPDPARGSDGTQLVFQSPPLEDTLRTEGSPVGHLTVSVDRPDGLLVGHLFEIDDEGQWHRVDRAYLDLEHRNGNDEGEPMPLLEPVDVPLTFYPQELVFEEEHRVGLVIATEDGEPRPHGKTRVQHHTTTVTVLDGELRFPLIPGS